MRMFTLNNQGNLVGYKEESYQVNHTEYDLEVLLENNPEYFFDDQKIMIIGRQVTTGFNTFIDLLGINAAGNTVIIELKRDRTPRETLAQLLEYASFVDTLDYDQLNEIFKNYTGEETELEEYGREYFEGGEDDLVSWNKTAILLIVGQTVSREIRQTSLYLRKKGIDVRCLEFKFFKTGDSEKIFTCDYVVGDDMMTNQKIQTYSLPKGDKTAFMDSLDRYGKVSFDRLFRFVEKENLLVRWGTKGFSVNYGNNGKFVALFFCYPPRSVFKQSIYTGYDEINKKINNPDLINDFYRNGVKHIGVFRNSQKSEKWILDRDYPASNIEEFLEIIKAIIPMISNAGWKGSD